VLVGASGNAATRVATFVCSQGAFAYGGYPDIDTLCQQQAVERNRTEREALLHRIQQLTIERVMFAPIMDFRTLVGLGPRIAEHALDTIPLHAWPAWEDMRIKGKNMDSAIQPPVPVSPVRSTSSRKEAGGVAGVADASSDQSNIVVFGGVVTPQKLQKRVSGYRNVPNVIGFSVQSAPKKTIEELTAAGQFYNRRLSITTIGEIQAAGQSVGVNVQVIAAPGRGFHSIVVAPRPLPNPAAQALSKVFRLIPNPTLLSQARQ